MNSKELAVHYAHLAEVERCAMVLFNEGLITNETRIQFVRRWMDNHPQFKAAVQQKLDDIAADIRQTTSSNGTE